jgi:hypothetical protein
MPGHASQIRPSAVLAAPVVMVRRLRRMRPVARAAERQRPQATIPPVRDPATR